MSGLTTGDSVKFKYKVKNEVGESTQFSPELSTYSAVAPAQMSAPTTAVSGNDVAISWTAPDNGGLAINSYKVFIRASNGSFI